MNDLRFDPHADDEDFPYEPVRNPNDRIAQLEAEVQRLTAALQAATGQRPAPAGSQVRRQYARTV